MAILGNAKAQGSISIAGNLSIFPEGVARGGDARASFHQENWHSDALSGATSSGEMLLLLAIVIATLIAAVVLVTLLF